MTNEREKKSRMKNDNQLENCIQCIANYKEETKNAREIGKAILPPALLMTFKRSDDIHTDPVGLGAQAARENLSFSSFVQLQLATKIGECRKINEKRKTKHYNRK